MPTLTLHHYKNNKQPYVAKIKMVEGGKTEYAWLPKIAARVATDKSYGEYQVTIDQPGFYRIGNAQSDECGHRLYYRTSEGNRFPFVRDPQKVQDIEQRIARGESIESIAKFYFE